MLTASYVASLPEVLQKALILDTETTGLGKGHAVFEAAIHNVGTSKTTKYFIAPSVYIKRQKELKLVESFSALQGMSQKWTRARMQPGKQFSYLSELYSDPAHIKSLKQSGRAVVGSRTFLTPTAFLQELTKDIKGASAILSANVNFENIMLSPAFQALDQHKQLALKKQFTSYAADSPRFLYRTTEMRGVYQAAMDSGSPEAWSRVGAAMLGKSSRPGIRVGDILDIGRASMAEAKMLGALKTSDFFTGLSMDAQGRAFGFGSAAHTAYKDVIAESKILLRGTDAYTRMSSLRQGGLEGFAAGIRGLVTGGGVLEDIQAFQRLEALQPVLKEQSIRQQLSHLELARRGLNVDEFYLRDTKKAFSAASWEQMVGGGWQQSRHEVTYRPKIPASTMSSDDMVNRFLTYAKSEFNLDQYGIDPDAVYKEIQNTHTMRLKHLYEPTASLDDAARLAQRNVDIMSKANIWGRKEIMKLLWENYRPHTIAAGALGVLLGLNLINRISSKDDDYNVLEGLPHGGQAEQMRRMMTEFGSGWTGQIEAFAEKMEDPRYRQHVRQDIAQRQRISQAALGRFVVSDYMSTNIITLEGLNQRNQATREVNLDRFSINVDDADTLILKRRGLFNLFKKPISIRLSGIDAPETEHDNDPIAPYRIAQQQPGGSVATEAMRAYLQHGDLRLFVDPSNMTYGRHLGAIYTGEQNIGLELTRQGLVASLSWRGKSLTDSRAFEKAQRGAQASGMGIWQYPFYQTYARHGKGVTFNMLTDITRVSSRPELKQLFTDVWTATPFSTMAAMPEQGLAPGIRHEMTDFMSIYGGMKNSLKALFSVQARARNIVDKLPGVVSSSIFVPSERLATSLYGQHGFAGMSGIMNPTTVLLEKIAGLGPVKGALKRDVTNLHKHIAKMTKGGDSNIAMVFPHKKSTSSIQKTAFHEYGHVITMRGMEATPESSKVFKEAFSSILEARPDQIPGLPTVARKMRDNIPNIAKMQDEFKAEAIAAYGQMTLQGKSKNIRFTSKYFSSAPTQQEMGAMNELGGRLWKEALQPQLETKAKIFSQWEDIKTVPNIAAMQDRGMAGATRHARTGYGSGWKGLQSTIQALDNFLGYSSPVVKDMFTSIPRVVDATIQREIRAANLPRVIVQTQSRSLTKNAVDQDIRRLITDNYSQKITAYTRKVSMANDQTRATYHMFANASRGARRHINRSQ